MRYLQVVENIQRINILCGSLSNILLLYLINRFSRPSLGTYKILLYIFATYDIFLCIVHGLIDHQVIIVDTMFVAVSRSSPEARVFTAFFCTSFTVPFALVIINFTYRYWAVENPERIRLFTRKPFCSLLVFSCFIVAASWFFAVYYGCTGEKESAAKTRARQAYRRHYGETIMEGYILMEHWNDGHFNLRPALLLLYFDSVIISCIIIAYSLAHRTLYSIRSTEKMSGKARLLQGRLLLALCAQTAVPVLSVFVPYFIVLTCPFFGVSDHGLTATMIILHSCFPFVDALVIIALMADYRNGVASILRNLFGLRNDAISAVSVVTNRPDWVKN